MYRKRVLYGILVLTVASWLVSIYMLMDVVPRSLALVGTFLVSSFLAVWGTVFFFLHRFDSSSSLRRGMLVSLAMVGYLILRLYSLDTVLTTILFFLLLLGLEFFYISR